MRKCDTCKEGNIVVGRFIEPSKIQVRKLLPPEQMRETILHECIHKALHNTNYLYPLYKGKEEEKVVQQITEELLYALYK